MIYTYFLQTYSWVFCWIPSGHRLYDVTQKKRGSRFGPQEVLHMLLNLSQYTPCKGV